MNGEPQDAMQSLRAKYPQYSNIGDTDLAKMVVAKYPQYQTAFSKYLQPTQQTPPAQQENPVVSAISQPGRTLGKASEDFRKGNVTGGLAQGATAGLQALSTPFSVADAAVRQVPYIGPLVSNMARSPFELMGYLANAINQGAKSVGIDPNLGLSNENAGKVNETLGNINALTAGGLVGEAMPKIIQKGVDLEGKRVAANQEKMVTRASAGIKKVASPQPKELTYDQALQRSVPYISEQQNATPLNPKSDVSAVRQATNILADAKTNLWENKISPIIDQFGNETINGGQIADAIRSGITDYTKRTSPKMVKELEDYAKSFEGEIPIAQANGFIKELNAKTSAYQKSPPVFQAQIEATNPRINAEVTAVEALRKSVYDKLGELGYPQVAKLKQDYGALSQIHRAMERKMVSAEKDATSASFYGKPFGTAVATGVTVQGFKNDFKTASLAAITGLIRKTIIDRNKPNPTIARAFSDLGKADLRPISVDVPDNPGGSKSSGGIPPINPNGGNGGGQPVNPMPGYYAQQARTAGVDFNGMQQTPKGGIPLFTDPVTRSTFTLAPGETVWQALARKRMQFRVAQP